MIEAVLFDFNGVLVDDEGQHCEAMQRVLADEGISLSREVYYAHILGLDDRGGFVEAYRRAQRTLTTELLNYMVKKKSQVYLQLVAKSLRVVPGAAEFVLEAAKRYRLGIVSGALRPEIDHVLAQIGRGLAERFEVIVAAGDVPPCKPDPACYLAAHQALAKRRPVSPHACAAIEDSLPGLQAARAAGMPCVMLTTSHAAKALHGRGAALVWDSFAGHNPGDLANL